MVSAAQVSKYSRDNRNVVELARNNLTQVWSGLNVSGDPARVRDALIDLFPDLVTVYGDVAAAIAADFYDDTRDAPGARYRAAPADTPDAAQSEAAARWGIGPLFQPEPDPSTALTQLSGSLQRLILQAGRSTLIQAARRDPVRTGFARIPQGPTCPWCVMLASRGFVYASEASAGAFNRWHDDCNCVIVPGRSARDLPDDYNLNEVRSLYSSGSGIPA